MFVLLFLLTLLELKLSTSRSMLDDFSCNGVSASASDARVPLELQELLMGCLKSMPEQGPESEFICLG